MRWGLKPLVFLASLVPCGLVVWNTATGAFINPVSDITLSTGLWTLRFVAITLGITPLRRLSGWSDAIKVRRMVGLFAFFYGCLHLTIYILDRVLVLGGPLNFSVVAEDIVERPYITVGFAGFVAMVPLAVTSTVGWIRRLGGRRWQRLHRLVYLTAVAGVIHFWWLVKADVREPMIYAGIMTGLLGYRVVIARRRRRASRRATAPVGGQTARRPS